MSNQAIKVPPKSEQGLEPLFDLIFVVEFNITEKSVNLIGFS